MNGVWKMNEDKQIVICKRCKKPEYWGEMRWLSGSCVCRDCYRVQFEQEEGELYRWNDLDGERPTMEECEEARQKSNETD